MFKLGRLSLKIVRPPAKEAFALPLLATVVFQVQLAPSSAAPLTLFVLVAVRSGPDAAWLTVNVCPATVIVPVRGLAVGFVVTEYWTEPFPFPVLPEVIVMKVLLLIAVHGQPPCEL